MRSWICETSTFDPSFLEGLLRTWSSQYCEMDIGQPLRNEAEANTTSHCAREVPSHLCRLGREVGRDARIPSTVGCPFRAA